MYQAGSRRRAPATRSRRSRLSRATTAAVCGSDVNIIADRSVISRSARLPRHGTRQTKSIAAIAATTARARTLSRSIVLIPGDAERAEGDEHQARGGELERKLRDAEYEGEHRERPAHRARERCFQPRRCGAPSQARADSDGREEQRVAGQSRFRRHLQMVVVRRAPVSRISARPLFRVMLVEAQAIAHEVVVEA